MSKPAFSIADLQQGSKRLHTVEDAAPRHAADKKGDDGDAEAIQQLESLYNKYDGDLDRIFDELRADPTKAKKPHHRPKNAHDFAKNYIAGFYSVLPDSADDHHADAKTSHK